MRWSMLVVMTILIGCNMSGCGIFNTEQMFDITTDAQGQRIAADTLRNWQTWRSLVDPQLENEKMKKRAPGFPTWNEKWIRQIRAIEESQENSPKYINYIIESRRRAGLPELEYNLPQ